MDEKKLRKGYTGYELTEVGRSDLLTHIQPVHPDVVAHHVTHEYGVFESLPPEATSVRVIAVAANDLVQAAIVKVNGTTTRVYGDSFYHITVSLDRKAGAQAAMSNDLIRDSRVWTAVEPFNVSVTPKFFPL